MAAMAATTSPEPTLLTRVTAWATSVGWVSSEDCGLLGSMVGTGRGVSANSGGLMQPCPSALITIPIWHTHSNTMSSSVLEQAGVSRR